MQRLRNAFGRLWNRTLVSRRLRELPVIDTRGTFLGLCWSLRTDGGGYPLTCGCALQLAACFEARPDVESGPFACQSVPDVLKP
jgi:hypothetical protein